jgi:hypothetical protein
MKKRTERRGRRQGESAASAELAFLVEPMLAGMTATRQYLLAWVHAHGLASVAAFRPRSAERADDAAAAGRRVDA